MVQNFISELTHVESASLELEIVGDMAEGVAEKSRAVLSSRLAALGARVPVSASKDRGSLRLRAVLTGPRAADVVYHIENLVSFKYYLRVQQKKP